ncbi:hypothetical protein HYZ06_01035 [Candidatus Daviesbacteria bacterium]|nr:hypothetical protein [Candidatus Daviesbacteria bacterium]
MIHEAERHILSSLPGKASLDRQLSTLVFTSDGEFVGRDLAEEPLSTERFTWPFYMLASYALFRVADAIGSPTLLLASVAVLIKGVSLFNVPPEGRRKTL